MSMFRIKILKNDGASYIFEDKIYTDYKEAHNKYTELVSHHAYNGTDEIEDIILEEKLEKGKK